MQSEVLGGLPQIVLETANAVQNVAGRYCRMPLCKRIHPPGRWPGWDRYNVPLSRPLLEILS